SRRSPSPTMAAACSWCSRAKVAPRWDRSRSPLLQPAATRTWLRCSMPASCRRPGTASTSACPDGFGPSAWPRRGADPQPPTGLLVGLAVGAAGEVDAELLELAVEMGALEPGALGHPRHAALLARKMVLEVDALEGVARLAQRHLERELLHGDAGVVGHRRRDVAGDEGLDGDGAGRERRGAAGGDGAGRHGDGRMRGARRLVAPGETGLDGLEQ